MFPSKKFLQTCVRLTVMMLVRFPYLTALETIEMVKGLSKKSTHF